MQLLRVRIAICEFAKNYEKLTDCVCFLFSIGRHFVEHVCATSSFSPLNICTRVWKFIDAICSFYCVSYELTFVSILV